MDESPTTGRARRLSRRSGDGGGARGPVRFAPGFAPRRFAPRRVVRSAVAGVTAAVAAGAAGLAGVSLGVASPARAERSAVGTRAEVVGGGAAPDTVTVTGSGFGHGVGLSQYGALGQARGGRSPRSILTHYYSGTTVEGYPDNVDLRVNVVDRGTSVSLRTEALADGGGAMQLVTGGGEVIDLPVGSSAVVTIEGGSLKVVTRAGAGSSRTFTTGGLTVRWSGARALAGPASVVKVTSRSANATSTSGKARSYRWGALQFLPVARDDSDGVARTRIEGVAILNLHREYLRGIAEVPSSWPAAALQSQVIAARNYALTEYKDGTSTTCGRCHLWDDSRSQVYRGWGTESVAAKWVSAVAATQTSTSAGLAILYSGAPVRAYYSSSSGGRTRDAATAWGTSVPYLRSVTDPWSVDPSVNPSYAKWQRSLPISKVAALFALPDIASIKVTERDRSGAAVTVTATAADGTTASLGGNTVRTKLGLPAPWLTSFELGSSS